jgi:hypothetical protein
MGWSRCHGSPYPRNASRSMIGRTVRHPCFEPQYNADRHSGRCHGRKSAAQQFGDYIDCGLLGKAFIHHTRIIDVVLPGFAAGPCIDIIVLGWRKMSRPTWHRGIGSIHSAVRHIYSSISADLMSPKNDTGPTTVNCWWRKAGQNQLLQAGSGIGAQASVCTRGICTQTSMRTTPADWVAGM